MDSSYGGTVAGGTTVIVISGIIYKIYKTINNHSINITCCGRKFSASVNIQDIPAKTESSRSSLRSTSSNHILEISDELKHRTDKYARRIQAAYRRYSSQKRLLAKVIA